MEYDHYKSKVGTKIKQETKFTVREATTPKVGSLKKTNKINFCNDLSVKNR